MAGWFWFSVCSYSSYIHHAYVVHNYNKYVILINYCTATYVFI